MGTVIGNTEALRTSDNRLGFVLALIFLPPLHRIFPLANPLRLKKIEGKRDSNMKTLTAESATNWKLKQCETGKV
jgi:hypothetical protein